MNKHELALLFTRDN